MVVAHRMFELDVEAVADDERNKYCRGDWLNTPTSALR